MFPGAGPQHAYELFLGTSKTLFGHEPPQNVDVHQRGPKKNPHKCLTVFPLCSSGGFRKSLVVNRCQ